MAVKIIVNILLIIGLGVAQMSFIAGLPEPFNGLNLILVILIFILGFTSFAFAARWALAVGFMLEIFSFLPFGAYLASLVLTVIIANFLLDYFFTNRSLYSFLTLVVSATIIYELLINSLPLIFPETDGYFFPASSGFWLATLKQSGLNLLLTLIIYYLAHIFGRNLKPVFLIKKEKR